jgi:hypothetical protein
MRHLGVLEGGSPPVPARCRHRALPPLHLWQSSPIVALLADKAERSRLSASAFIARKELT